MTAPRFDHYPRYDELTGWIREIADAHPEIVQVESIGHSYEGRDLWLATVTNRSLGEHHTKPAIWIDGNIHAPEVTASVAVMHLLHQLTSAYGDDERITRAVDTRTFYLLPRLNPDGAELVLGEVPRWVRGSVHPWPVAEQADGLIGSDIDRDGRILQMRIPDPNGIWKPSSIEPALMVARGADEDGDGPYYRLLCEGTIQDFDGVTMENAPYLAGIDPNRQFPYKWERHVSGKYNAGDYPGSEPEIAAILKAITERRNICAYFAYHTHSGVHIRAYSDQSDDAFAAEDLWTYEFLGERATALTGYPAISGYEDFRYHPKSVIRGVGTDWAFDQLGVYAWTTEFWNPVRMAGIDNTAPLEWYRTHDLDDELKLLSWVNENVPNGYVEWYEFDHPQLGTVELGGWDTMKVFRNPPPHLLEAEIAPHSELAVFVALSTPRLRVRETLVDRLADDVFRVRVVIENAGWMNTSVTERALKVDAVLPLRATIDVPDGVELVRGAPTLELGQLDGRALKQNAVRTHRLTSDGTADRTVAEWLLRGPVGAEIPVSVHHDRAGRIDTVITLENRSV